MPRRLTGWTHSAARSSPSRVAREQGLAPRPRAQSKWYFTDPGLAGLASTFGAGGPPSLAALSEQQLALCILRALEQQSAGAAVAAKSSDTKSISAGLVAFLIGG